MLRNEKFVGRYASGQSSLVVTQAGVLPFAGSNPCPAHHILFSSRGEVAQLVEHWTENPGVGGSIPPFSTTSLSVPAKLERPERQIVDLEVLGSNPRAGTTEGAGMKLMRESEKLRQGLEDMCEYLAPTGWTMVEVGSYAGESAEIFARHFDGVYCVDPWADALCRERERHTPMAMVESAFNRRVGHLPNVHKLKMTSREAAARCNDGSLDFVYIDGDHLYESVVADIRAWLPKIRPGGFIGGHDYFSPGHVKSVVMAVNDELGEPSATFWDGSWVRNL